MESIRSNDRSDYITVKFLPLGHEFSIKRSELHYLIDLAISGNIDAIFAIVGLDVEEAKFQPGFHEIIIHIPW